MVRKLTSKDEEAVNAIGQLLAQNPNGILKGVVFDTLRRKNLMPKTPEGGEDRRWLGALLNRAGALRVTRARGGDQEYYIHREFWRDDQAKPEPHRAWIQAPRTRWDQLAPKVKAAAAAPQPADEPDTGGLEEPAPEEDRWYDCLSALERFGYEHPELGRLAELLGMVVGNKVMAECLVFRQSAEVEITEGKDAITMRGGVLGAILFRRLS
jgi:hypothetical protein